MPLIADRRRQVNQILDEYRHAKKQAEVESVALDSAQKDLHATEKAQQILQDLAKAIQQQAHDQIEAVVSRCLKAIFGKDAYEFKIDFQKKRGKTEAQLLFLEGDLVLEDPQDNSSGGQIDMASFALRLACLQLSRPRKRLFLAMDEPFKWLNPDKYHLVPQLLEMLAEELGAQFLLTTNIPEIATGKIINLSAEDKSE